MKEKAMTPDQVRAALISAFKWPVDYSVLEESAPDTPAEDAIILESDVDLRRILYRMEDYPFAVVLPEVLVGLIDDSDRTGINDVVYALSPPFGYRARFEAFGPAPSAGNISDGLKPLMDSEQDEQRRAEEDRVRLRQRYGQFRPEQVKAIAAWLHLVSDWDADGRLGDEPFDEYGLREAIHFWDATSQTGLPL